jgi:hypothetical protein
MNDFCRSMDLKDVKTWPALPLFLSPQKKVKPVSGHQIKLMIGIGFGKGHGRFKIEKLSFSVHNRKIT